MAKQLNIDMSIKANTQQAQQALNSLNKSLQSIQNIKNMPMINDKSYESAANAARDLERNLQAAINVDTGKLDLSKFSLSLKKSNTSITELAIKLSGAGATGQQAFLNLAKSIALADNSALSLGTKLGGLMTTLKNTARWQISSSLLHGFISTISGAYHYAQDLNESLNNIRIVTGQSVEEMAKFAKEANTAAKALSTTTTEYTNASLIYYQQGLSESEVKTRTDATIKLANVSRQSAEEVSSQMTAIWNNFAKGNENLEYYEDVITKLGATTASSSSEIAEGISKFAAVADTVDLSYEKATASLATVVAETRQSAETVGTAFKTLFARIEGLKLGETLEDGTDLNKYSKTLETVGVNIKDQSGQLKSMDTILNDIGAKWNALSKDQQVALAQTVAGVRQYTQFISLMDNYDKVLKNEETAKNSSGTVDQQAKIYAESWEAARDRVKAAAEEIYNQLLDDKVFITLLNGLEKILEFVSNIIDGMGGLKGVLLLVGSIFMNSYAKEMPRIFSNLSQNLMIIAGQGEKIKQNMLEELEVSLILNKNSQVGISHEMQAKYEATQRAVEMTKALNAAIKTLSQTEIEEYKAKIAQTTQEGEYLALLGKELDQLEKKNARAAEIAASGAAASYGDARKTKENPNGFSDDYVAGSSFEEAINEELERQKSLRADIRELKSAEIVDEQAIEEKEKYIVDSKLKIKALQAEEANVLKFINGEYQQAVGKERILSEEAKNIVTRVKNWEDAEKKINKLLQGNTQEQKIGKKTAEELAKQMSSYGEYLDRLQKKGILPEDAIGKINEFKNALETAKKSGDWNDVFTLLKDKVDGVFGLLNGEAFEASEALDLVREKGEQMGIVFNTPALKEMTADMGDAAVKTEQLSEGMERLNVNSSQALSKGMQMGEAIGKLGGTIMQVSMAINGLKNIGNIWSNEDLSTGEKLLQTMTSLSMILPVITMFTNKQKLAEISLAAAKLLHIGGSSGVTAAEWAEAAAKEGSAAATWTLIWPVGVLMLAILALVAVVWLIVEAFKAWQASTPEGKLKTANEELENATEAAEKAKTAFDDLKSTIENYDSAVDSLKGLVKGTDEFKEAVKKANEEARKLIETNDELKGKYHYNTETGLIEFDEGVLEDLKKSGEDKYNAAEASKLIAANNVSRAENNVTLSDASKKNDVNLWKSAGIAAGATAVGLPTVGAAVWGASQLQATKDVYENQQSNAALAHFSEIVDSYENISLDQAAAMGLLSDREYDLINSLGLTEDELKNLTSEVNANTDAIIENNKQIVDNKFKEDKTYKNSKNQDDLNVVLAKQLEPAMQKIYESTYKEGKGISDKDAQKQYAQALGYEWVKSDGDAGVYKDSSGEEVSVNNEIARQYLAEQDALKGLTGTIETTDKVLTKLHQNEDIASQAVLSKMTKGDFSDVELAEKGKTYTVDELQGQLSDEEFAAIYTSLGYSSAEEFAKSFNQELNSLTTIDDVIDSIELSEEDKAKYADKLESIFSDLTASEAQNLSKGINTLVSSFGEDVGADFVDTLDDITKGLSKEEKKIVTKQLGEINDIGDAAQWDKFLKSIQDSDKVTESTKKDFEGYVKQAKDVANAVNKISFDEFIAGLGKVDSTLKKMSEGNKVVTKDEMDELVANGADASQFIRTLSDDFEYIGSMTTLMSDVEANTKASFDSAINSFIQAGEASIQSAQNTDELIENLNHLKETSSDTGEELTESQKFVEMIKSIWQKIVKKAQAAAAKVKAWLIEKWNWVKTNIIDPVAKTLKSWYDGLVKAWNGFIDGLFGMINKFIRGINSVLEKLGIDGIDELDASKHHGKTSEELEAERKAEKAKEARKQSHEDFMTTSEETVSYIQSYGAEISPEERGKIESSAKNQLDAVQKELKETKEKLANKNLSADDREYYEGLKSDLEDEVEQIHKIEQAWHQVDIAQINTATSLSDFNHKVEQAKSSGEVSYDIIADGLLNLAKGYENCSEEILNYNQALASGSEELIYEEEAILRNAIAVGELSKALDLEADAVEEQAKELISVNNLSEDNYEVATKVAVLNQTMNKGVSTLVKNWESYKEALQSAEKGTEEYATAALDTKKALSQLLGVLDEDYIPDDFLELPGVMDLIDKAVEGDEEAINELGATMAKATVEAWEFKKGMLQIAQNDETGEHLAMSATMFEEYKNEVLEGITALTEAITNGTLQAGEDITSLMDGTGESWINALNEMAFATGMSVDEMNSMLNELGVQADVTTKTKEVETQVPEYTTYESTDLKGDKNEGSDEMKGYKAVKKSVTVQTGTKKVKGSIDVAQINMGDDAGTPPTITYAGRDNVSSSALTSDSSSNSSSGSSSSNKTTSAASHEHTVNRYSDEKNAVEGLSDQLERLSKIKEDAFGAGQIQAIELEIKKMKELTGASEDYLDAIVGAGNASLVAETLYNGGSIGSLISSGQLGGTIAQDYNALFGGTSASGKNLEYTAKDSDGNQWLAEDNFNINDWGSMFGGSFDYQIDSYGNITNKDALLNQIEAQKNKENDIYSSYSDPDAATTTEHNKRIAYLDEIKSRIEQYGTTIEDLETQADAYLENISKLQDKNAELISAKLNNGISLSNNTLTRIERAVKILGNDIYKSTEKMADWFDTKNSNREEYQKQAKLNDEAAADIKERVEKYKANPLDKDAISPAKAAEMMEEIAGNYDTLYDKAITDITEQEEKYKNVWSEWSEKIQQVTTAIDHNIEKLSHLRKVFELLGKSADYNKLGKLLEAQSKAANVNYNVQKAKADEARALYKEHKAYADTLSGTELEEYEKTVLAEDRAKVQEWEKEEQAAFEEKITALQAIHENNINKIYQQFEDNLAGEYGSFAMLDASMARQKSITEEYLTKTNQLYETNKMLRTLQGDIDKTSNRMAKERLKAFSDEIEALQKQEKLTKTDLEIAKARYEVLKSQVALEEAQNAKSTVRLQRDNEGNYGYVYTADQDKVSEAEQNLEDKKNALYNLALQQANDFSQKMAQIGQEYKEAMEKLREEYETGKISEEQYQQSLLELNQYYQDLELRYLDGYNKAAEILDEEAITDRSEAYGAQYEDLLNQQRLFNDDSTGAAQELNQQLSDEMEDWEQTTADLLEEAGLNNEEFQETVNEVTEEIEDLGDQITKEGGLVDQFDELAVATEELTREFVANYEALLDEAQGYLEAANEASSYCDELRDLTNQQLAYNAALAAQPSNATGGNSTANYGNNSDGSGDGSTGGSNTDKTGGIKSTGEDQEDAVSEWHYDKDYHWRFKNGKKVDYGRHGWHRTSLSNPGNSGTYYHGMECPTCGATGQTVNYTSYPPRSVEKIFGGLKLKTGGYTGTWNGPDTEDNGKLAFLHQKELVLNADDTENVLNAIKLIRQINQTIDLQAAAQSSSYGIQAALFKGQDQILQQEVTIHAEFPNVSDHNEIEEALNNLVNRASQYANHY